MITQLVLYDYAPTILVRTTAFEVYYLSCRHPLSVKGTRSSSLVLPSMTFVFIPHCRVYILFFASEYILFKSKVI